jgi:hypothetical protein
LAIKILRERETARERERERETEREREAQPGHQPGSPDRGLLHEWLLEDEAVASGASASTHTHIL